VLKHCECRSLENISVRSQIGLESNLMRTHKELVEANELESEHITNDVLRKVSEQHGVRHWSNRLHVLVVVILVSTDCVRFSLCQSSRPNRAYDARAGCPKGPDNDHLKENTMHNTTERKDIYCRIDAQIVERRNEIIDARELSKRWQVPQTWIRNWTREGYANDPIPM